MTEEQGESSLKTQDVIIIDLGNKAGREAVSYPGQVINSWGRHFASLSPHFLICLLGMLIPFQHTSWGREKQMLYQVPCVPGADISSILQPLGRGFGPLLGAFAGNRFMSQPHVLLLVWCQVLVLRTSWQRGVVNRGTPCGGILMLPFIMDSSISPTELFWEWNKRACVNLPSTY